jgi:8-oxo-dGTP diphosphatase
VNTRIHVAVGVIYNSNKDKILITKRTDKQHLAGLWEFPGGKLEESEDVMSALRRELYEELGIVVKNAKQFTTISYNYPDKKVLLDVWKVSEWNGEPASRENQEIAWSRVSELNKYEFPEANKHIIQTLSLSSVYVISQESYENTTRLLSIASEYFSAGLKLFQLRLKSRNNSDFSVLVKKLTELAKKNNAKLILNGTPSDVSTYNVDGLHLKSNVLMEYDSRPISEDYILGASCHNEEELAHAERLNVNYVFISPVLKTNSHPGQNAIGWDKFFKLTKKINFPVYALGGMTPADLKIAKSYNAHGVAMIGAIWNSKVAINNIFSN